MKSTPLSDIAHFCSGSLSGGGDDVLVSGVSTDTRTIGVGDLFVPLKGDHFNGHDFIARAVEAGASAYLTSEDRPDLRKLGCPALQVGDTLDALQAIAAAYRRTRPDLHVVGVTGSNGKTSTKDLLGAVLRRKYSVNSTLGNLNNHIGLPLTMLRTEPTHDCAVWEMGMNHPGEIEVLARIAGPTVGVITNIGRAHIEFMKTQDAIALEKGMLAEAVPADGCVVLNADDAYTDSIAKRCRARVVRAGIGSGEVRAESIVAHASGFRFDLVTPQGAAEVDFPVLGTHMIGNAMLAAAAGLGLGVSLEEIAAGLSSVELTGGRLQRREIGGVLYLDDSYNANPDSMRAAIVTLMGIATDGRRVALLGTMGELGPDSDAEHADLGAFAAESGVDLVIGVGPGGKLCAEAAARSQAAAETFQDHESCAEFLKKTVSRSDVVLVKGSRAAGMERILAAMEKEGTAA